MHDLVMASEVHNEAAYQSCLCTHVACMVLFTMLLSHQSLAILGQRKCVRFDSSDLSDLSTPPLIPLSLSVVSALGFHFVVVAAPGSVQFPRK